VPIVADAEAGFGGVLNAFELMKAMIEAGAAGVHFEDQLASVKKCGHMGGKVLVPTREAVASSTPRAWPPTSAACRPCSSRAPTPKPPTCSPPTSTSATSPSSPASARSKASTACAQRPRPGDQPRPRLRAVRRPGLVRDRQADLEEARKFAEAIHAKFPGKLLAYNCSPSFNWKKNLDDATIAKFQKELGAMGYKFQFITLAGFHSAQLRCSIWRAATRATR
jgi:isocitrate lyase